MTKATRAQIGKEQKKRIENISGLSVLDWKGAEGAVFTKITKDLYDLRSILMGDGLFSTNIAFQMQEERIKLMKSDLEEANSRLEYLFLQVKEKEEELEDFCKKHQKALEKEQRQFMKASKVHSKSENNFRELEKELMNAKEVYEKMQRNILLVHRTVSRGQLANQYGKVVVTKADFQTFTFSDVQVNAVFEEKDSEDFITNLPYYFYSKYNGEEQKSIIDFCEMVIYFTMQEDEKEVVPIFSNKDIVEILRMNGMEF